MLLKFIAMLIFLVLIAHFWNTIFNQNPSESETNTNKHNSFNKKKYSTTYAGSLWVIVNKTHPLSPIEFKPVSEVPKVTLKAPSTAENMRVSVQMASNLSLLFKSAKLAGFNLMLSSGYRSYAYQKDVYNGLVKTLGKSVADRQSARPGYSEHQTGLAVDVAPTSGTCDLNVCFGQTPEGKWLANNAYKYGFIIRYPLNAESITGYEYEPWHLRYIGTDLAKEMHRTASNTLEEFFQVSGGEAYN